MLQLPVNHPIRNKVDNICSLKGPSVVDNGDIHGCVISGHHDEKCAERHQCNSNDLQCFTVLQYK